MILTIQKCSGGIWGALRGDWAIGGGRGVGGCKAPRLGAGPRSSSFQAGGGRAGAGLAAAAGEDAGGSRRRRTAARAPAERGPRGPDQQVSLLPQRTAARPPRPLGSRLAGSTVRSHRVRSLFSPRPAAA